MRKLTIDIDCDDVLVPSTYALVDEYNPRYGTIVSYERCSHEAGNNEWGVDRETAKHRIHDIRLADAYRAIDLAGFER